MLVVYRHGPCIFQTGRARQTPAGLGAINEVVLNMISFLRRRLAGARLVLSRPHCHSIVVSTCAAAFMLAAVGAQANITYSIDVSSFPSAGTVTGTITTDGATGLLQPSDFIAWSIAATSPNAVLLPPAAFTITSADLNAQVTCAGLPDGCALSATTSELILAIPPATSLFAATAFQAQDVEYGVTFSWPEFKGPGAFVICFLCASQAEVWDAFAGSEVVGTASAGTVPEPSMVGLLAMALTVLVFVHLRTARRHTTQV